MQIRIFWRKDLFTRKRIARENWYIKIFVYSPLGKELHAHTDIAKKQYQQLEEIFFSNKDNKNVNESLIKKEMKKYIKLNLI